VPEQPPDPGEGLTRTPVARCRLLKLEGLGHGRSRTSKEDS